MPTPQQPPTHSPYRVGDDIDNETFFDTLQFEDTGILTDRELRWRLTDIANDTQRLIPEVDSDADPSVLFDDLASACRQVATLLGVWQQQLAVSPPVSGE